MKIALVGYGKMGKAIEKIAIGRGHTIKTIVDKNNSSEKLGNVCLLYTSDAADED